MKTYSMDLRERVIGLCDRKAGTRKEIAALMGVSTAWIRRLLQRRRESGGIAPRPHGGGRRSAFTGQSLEDLKAMVAKQPDSTLEELRDRCGVVERNHAGTMRVFRALKKAGSRLKKSRSSPSKGRGRTWPKGG